MDERPLADEALERGDPRLVGLNQIGASSSKLPASYLSTQIRSGFGRRRGALPVRAGYRRQELLRDLLLKLDAVGSASCHSATRITLEDLFDRFCANVRGSTGAEGAHPKYDQDHVSGIDDGEDQHLPPPEAGFAPAPP